VSLPSFCSALWSNPVECDILPSSADVCLDSEAEARCVNAHLCVAQTQANSIADNFGADRSKALKLTILQDRIAEAGVLAETSRSALALVHEAMFPLNNQPEGLLRCLIDSRMAMLSTPSFENTCAVGLWSHFPSCVFITLRLTWSC
jgi:hypothetical protein